MSDELIFAEESAAAPDLADTQLFSGAPLDAAPAAPEPITTLALNYNDELKRAELHSPEAPDIGDVRAIAGTTRPELPPQWAERWNDGAEAHALGFMVQQGLPAATCQGILDWYTDATIVYGYQNAGEAIAAFREAFKGVLTERQLDQMQNYYSTKVAPIERRGDGW